MKITKVEMQHFVFIKNLCDQAATGRSKHFTLLYLITGTVATPRKIHVPFRDAAVSADHNFHCILYDFLKIME